MSPAALAVLALLTSPAGDWVGGSAAFRFERIDGPPSTVLLVVARRRADAGIRSAQELWRWDGDAAAETAGEPTIYVLDDVLELGGRATSHDGSAWTFRGLSLVREAAGASEQWRSSTRPAGVVTAGRDLAACLAPPVEAGAAVGEGSAAELDVPRQWIQRRPIPQTVRLVEVDGALELRQWVGVAASGAPARAADLVHPVGSVERAGRGWRLVMTGAAFGERWIVRPDGALEVRDVDGLVVVWESAAVE